MGVAFAPRTFQPAAALGSFLGLALQEGQLGVCRRSFRGPYLVPIASPQVSARSRTCTSGSLTRSLSR